MATQRSSALRLILTLTLVAVARGLPVRAADAPGQGAAALKVPEWIESLRDSATSRTGPAEGGPNPATVEDTVVPAVGDVTGAAAARPAADWRDSKPPSPTSPAPIVRTGGDPRPAPVAQPQPGGFRRWISERLASLPSASPPSQPGDQAGPPADEPIREPEPPAGDPPPVAATPDEMPTLSIDPASFRGAHPGRTTRAELEEAWGPANADEDGEPGTGSWSMEPFAKVEVTFTEETVSAIGIKLAEPMPVPDLARQLEIADLRTVAVKDDQGREIGEVFPERGVILSIEPGTRQATAILIEPLDPDAFVLRAEGELESCSAYAVADLQYAIEIDPRHARAHRMLLKMVSDQGQWTQALQLAEKAARLDPDDAWVRLKQARVLLALDRPAEARDVIQQVKSGPDAPPIIAAQCQRLLGRAAMAGKAPDHRAAVEHFTESIRLAAPLLSKKSPGVQAAARETLLDAHLGTALAIAAGSWQQKSRVIPKWIVRSEAVVKEFKGTVAERQVLELQLCRGALAVAAGSTESIEPLPWVKRLLELRDQMGETILDPWKRRQLDWEVGQGLADALTAAQIRGDSSDMLDNSTLTAAYLERGGERRELTPGERKQLGDLMFRIGILHSLQRGDHATAVTWFDRTVPLWDDNDRFAADGEFGRLGESYVSMAISYWQVERREDALDLGRRGVDLMVSAVDAGQLEERALAVAYGNLATMYAEQGDEERSRSYAEMASRAEAADGVIR